MPHPKVGLKDTFSHRHTSQRTVSSTLGQVLEISLDPIADAESNLIGQGSLGCVSQATPGDHSALTFYPGTAGLFAFLLGIPTRPSQCKVTEGGRN